MRRFLLVAGVLIAILIVLAIVLGEELWGDRHFTIVDPNGVGIDIVTYSKP